LVCFVAANRIRSEFDRAPIISDFMMMRAGQLIAFDDRASDSPHVLRIWRSESCRDGEFLSVAYPQWELVIARVGQTLSMYLRGPETKATRSHVPAGGVWLGIRFRAGAYMRGVNHAALRDHSLELPVTKDGRFWLNGAEWEVPTFENADDLVSGLSQSGDLTRDVVVSSTLAGRAFGGSERTRQRRFALTTGLNHQAVASIERAHCAVIMLQDGLSIGDTVALAGFSDQSHLTRSMKALIGVTPGQLAAKRDTLQLSFVPRSDKHQSWAPVQLPM
jgi:AraC-like DNA-binding protein